MRMFIAVDFSVPVFDEFYTAVLHKEEKVRVINYWVFLDIFDGTTWFCIGIAIAVLCLAFSGIQLLLQEEAKPSLFNTFCLVSFSIVQLDYEYRVSLSRALQIDTFLKSLSFRPLLCRPKLFWY